MHKNALLQGCLQRHAVALAVVVMPMQLGCSGDDGADEHGKFDRPSSIEKGTISQTLDEYIRNPYDFSRVRHTFSMNSGGVVDCLDIDAQPSVLLSGEPVQLKPSASLPLQELGMLNVTRAEALEGVLTQEPDPSGQPRTCPEGTVPKLRPTADLKNHFDSMRAYQAKPRVAPGVGGAPHNWVQLAQLNVDVQGGESIMSVHDPYVLQTDEFSLMQIWLTAGGTGAGLQTLEAGWIEFRNQNGDWLPHLFIYSTQDAYNTTGCWNGTCGDFVQTDSSIVIGGPLSFAAIGSTPKKLGIMFYRDQTTGNWWLYVNGFQIGYYRSSLFNAAGLRDRATNYLVGGEIVNDYVGSVHTTTEMGSGRWSSAGYKRAAFHSYAYMLNSGAWPIIPTLSVPPAPWGGVTHDNCYDWSRTPPPAPNDDFGQSYFYLGGPGARDYPACTGR